jgi:AmmeMemoRadiSam system protein B
MRKSPLAGSWYPKTSGEIKGLVNKFLDNAELPDIKGRPVGMISPHAGIQFSGQAASYGYKAVKGLGIGRVIIMGPSHYVPFRGVAVSEEDMYVTPMGKIEVDKKITDDLYDQPLFKGPRNAEIQEHSLEMQLPFLQVVLDAFKIVPLVVGDVSGSEYNDIAQDIKRYADENTLIIASSDFTHYGGRFGYVPFQRDIKKNIENLDLGAIERIIEGDFNGYLKYLDKTGATICGARPIGILMKIFERDADSVLLNYTTSGEILDNFTDSVSYASILFTQSQ